MLPMQSTTNRARVPSPLAVTVTVVSHTVPWVSFTNRTVRVSASSENSTRTVVGSTSWDTAMSDTARETESGSAALAPDQRQLGPLQLDRRSQVVAALLYALDHGGQQPVVVIRRTHRAHEHHQRADVVRHACAT